MILATEDQTIIAVMDAAVDTTAPCFVVGYADVSDEEFNPGAEHGVLDGTTPVTVVSAPASDYARQVKSINLHNDDAVDHTITLSLDDAGVIRTTYELELKSGETALYTFSRGWAGVIKAGPPGPGVPAGGTTGQVLAKASDADFDTQWVSGGGGGGGYFAGYSVTGAIIDTTSNFNTKGSVVQPLVPITVTGITAPIHTASSGRYYHAQIAEINGSNEVVSVLGTSDSVEVPDVKAYEWTFSPPINLASGTRYVVVLVREDGTGTSPAHLRNVGTADPDISLNAPALIELGTAFQYDTIDLSVSQSPSAVGTTMYVFGLRGTIT